jgi:methionyl aminopeptidase
VVGDARPAESLALIEVTERALAAAIAVAGPGTKVGDLSHTIGTVLGDAGYPVNTQFGGHGVGRTMHEAPSIPNAGTAGHGPQLRSGLVIAIEPWFLAGGRDVYRIDRDGWTIRSGDGSRAAHAEHTVAVTEDGPQVLTVL